MGLKSLMSRSVGVKAIGGERRREASVTSQRSQLA